MTCLAKFALVLSAVLPGTVNMVLAHAVLLETVPPVRGAVTGPDVVFHLRFNLRIDAARSALNLVLPDGKIRPLATTRQSSPDSLNARSAELKSGHYLLRWQVLAVDGHITRGEIPFDVR